MEKSSFEKQVNCTSTAFTMPCKRIHTNFYSFYHVTATNFNVFKIKWTDQRRVSTLRWKVVSSLLAFNKSEKCAHFSMKAFVKTLVKKQTGRRPKKPPSRYHQNTKRRDFIKTYFYGRMAQLRSRPKFVWKSTARPRNTRSQTLAQLTCLSWSHFAFKRTGKCSCL